MLGSSVLFTCTLVSSFLGAATAVGPANLPNYKPLGSPSVTLPTTIKATAHRGPDVGRPNVPVAGSRRGPGPRKPTIPRRLYLGSIRRPDAVLKAGGLRNSGKGEQSIRLTASLKEAKTSALSLRLKANNPELPQAQEPPRPTIDYGYVYYINTTDIDSMFVRGMPRRASPESAPKDQFKAIAPIPKAHIDGWDLVLPNGETVYYTNDDFWVGPHSLNPWLSKET
ncbi:hypothetical protein PspLS_11312 [Pyricularia sp. CBS 133598]|nr:hypothetical protein PspLS_11312 [Pyricularia sp. CBS 133598]